jgi:hypothetical protein
MTDRRRRVKLVVPANRDVGDGDDGSRLGGDKNELALEAGEQAGRKMTHPDPASWQDGSPGTR